ncbi:exonuclease GOR-like [Haemaphysalis longicornis]
MTDISTSGDRKDIATAADDMDLQCTAPTEDYLQEASALAVSSATLLDANPMEGNRSLLHRSEGFYNQMVGYMLTPEQLYDGGYLRLCPRKPGRIVCVLAEAEYSSYKTCSRCASSFVITAGGKYCSISSCCYHPGKCTAFGFSCCGARPGQAGCKSSPYHVCTLGARNEWDTPAWAFVRTPRRCTVNGGVFALDCEMSFTIRGFEVTRVSVVDGNGTTVYDSYVTPGSPVLDYNTVYSGVTAERLRDERTTLQDVQAVLLRLFSASTVLVGHGLENDLRCLRLLHDTVVDTAVVFPHNRGLPFRRSLRSLVGTYLNREVPEGPLGHDTVERAKACMQLLLWKAAQDKKLRERQSQGAADWVRRPSQ